MKRLTQLFILLFFSAITTAGFGQGFDDDVDDTTTSAPIDGGLSLLIAAGVGYGARKAHQHRKKQREKAGE